MMTYADIYKRHAWLFACSEPGQPVYTIEVGYGIEIGPGWLDLLDRALTDIGDEVRLAKGEMADFKVIQIKERFGELCIYTRGENQRIAVIIDTAEALSRKTCEECGDYGFEHLFDDEWYWTLCSDCAVERAKSRHMSVHVEHTHGEVN